MTSSSVKTWQLNFCQKTYIILTSMVTRLGKTNKMQFNQYKYYDC